MKSLLLFFTVWCLTYLTLSDGKTIKYDVGTIGYTPGIIVSHTESYYVICLRLCEIEKVEVTLNNGHGKLVGYHGDEGNSLKFCEGQFNKLTGLTECRMLIEKEKISNVQIKIRADTKCRNMTLLVTGEVWRISPTPMQVVTKEVGTLSKGQQKSWYVKCSDENGKCRTKKFSATWDSEKGGNVLLYGYYGRGSIFCWGEDESATNYQNCKLWYPATLNNPDGFQGAEVIVKATKDSEGVELLVEGDNVDAFEPGRYG